MLPKLPYALVVITLLPAIAVAEGLIYQLPDDGHWVRFQMTKTNFKSSHPTLGDLTLSSVGTEEVDGYKCRWIEIDYAMEGWKAKLLIPELHLGKGKEPLKHVLKAWYKYGTNNPIENKDLAVLVGPDHIQELNSFFHGPVESTTAIEATEIDCKLGKLDCKGVEVDETTRGKELRNGIKYSIRLHEKAPFGVVVWEKKYHREIDTRDAPLQGWAKTVLRFADTGTDAKSSMPEAK